jgi:hypothetical protein
MIGLPDVLGNEIFAPLNPDAGRVPFWAIGGDFET